MDYSFIRKLVKNISDADAKYIFDSLTNQGIEIFLKVEDKFENATRELVAAKELYVSAADLQYAREIVQRIGLEQYLCNETEINANIVKSEVEKAEEEFFHKHKQNQLFALVIIAGVIVFMMMQFFAK